jgi:hypothetical protein
MSLSEGLFGKADPDASRDDVYLGSTARPKRSRRDCQPADIWPVLCTPIHFPGQLAGEDRPVGPCTVARSGSPSSRLVSQFGGLGAVTSRRPIPARLIREGRTQTALEVCSSWAPR